MTANNSPSPVVVKASSELSATQAAWKAFNNTNTDTTDAWHSATSSGIHWLEVDFGSQKTIATYTITSRNDATNMWPIKSWKLQGSNDDSTWTDLDTQTGVPTWTANEKRSYAIATPGSYRYYRLYITDTFGGYAAIGELELIRKAQWLTIDPANLTSIKNDGMTTTQLNAVTADQWAQLMTAGKIRLAYYLEQSAVTDTCTVDSLTATTLQTVLTPSISSLNVLYNILGIPTFYVSRDDGVTWKQIQPDTLTDLTDLPSGQKLRVKIVLSTGQEIWGISYSWI
jgi:hypothetical protein